MISSASAAITFCGCKKIIHTNKTDQNKILAIFFISTPRSSVRSAATKPTIPEWTKQRSIILQTVQSVLRQIRIPLRQTDAEKSATYVIPSIFNSAFKSAGSTGSVSISSRKKSRINEILDSVYPKIKTDVAIPTSNASSPPFFFSKSQKNHEAIPIIPIFIIDITYETGFPSL